MWSMACRSWGSEEMLSSVLWRQTSTRQTFLGLLNLWLEGHMHLNASQFNSIHMTHVALHVTALLTSTCSSQKKVDFIGKPVRNPYPKRPHSFEEMAITRKLFVLTMRQRSYGLCSIRCTRVSFGDLIACNDRPHSASICEFSLDHRPFVQTPVMLDVQYSAQKWLAWPSMSLRETKNIKKPINRW